MFRSPNRGKICSWGFSQMGPSTTFQDQNTKKRLFPASCETKLADPVRYRGVYRIYIWASWLFTRVGGCQEEDLSRRGSWLSRSGKSYQAADQRGKGPEDPESEVFLSKLQSWSLSRLFQGKCWSSISRFALSFDYYPDCLFLAQRPVDGEQVFPMYHFNTLH